MKKKAKRGSLGIVSILTITFAVLKLANVITWPWLWVLSPVWISLLLACLIFVVILIAGRLKKGKW